MRMERICRWLTAAVVFWFLAPAVPAAAEPETIPFVPGETLTFELRWGFIPAGTAVFVAGLTFGGQKLAAGAKDIASALKPGSGDS